MRTFVVGIVLFVVSLDIPCEAGFDLEPQAIATISKLKVIDQNERADEIYLIIDGQRCDKNTDGDSYWLFQDPALDDGGRLEWPINRPLFMGNSGEVRLGIMEQTPGSHENLGITTLRFKDGEFNGLINSTGAKITSDNSPIQPREIVIQFVANDDEVDNDSKNEDPRSEYEMTIVINENKLGANVCVGLKWYNDQRANITPDEKVPANSGYAKDDERHDEVYILRSLRVREDHKPDVTYNLPRIPNGGHYYIITADTHPTWGWRYRLNGPQVQFPVLGGGVIFEDRSLDCSCIVYERDSVTYWEDHDNNPETPDLASFNADDLLGVFTVSLELVRTADGKHDVKHTWKAQGNGPPGISETIPIMGNGPVVRVGEQEEVYIRPQYLLMGFIKVLKGNQTCAD